MKLTKKLLALALVLAMVLAMAVTVSAAGGKIKIDGSSGTVYEVYLMFEMTKINDTYVYKPTTDWVDFISHPGVSNYLVEIANGYVSWKDGVFVNGANTKALAQLASQYATLKSLEKLGVVKADTTENELTVSADGYYLLKTANISGVVAVVENKEVEVTDKNPAGGGSEGLPTVSKQVQEDSTGDWVQDNTADIGQTVNFKTTIKTNAGASNYILHDVMASAITFNNDVAINHVRGDVTTKVDASNYTVITTGITDDCRFHITFLQTFLDTLVDNDQLVITYSGYLNTNATADTMYENKSWLTHTATNIDGNIDQNITKTKTHKFEINKQDEKGEALQGAGFTLKNSSSEVINLYMTSEGNYIVCEHTVCPIAEHSSHVTTAVTGSTGTINIVGLDADTYTIEETQVPAGYVKAADTTEAIPTKASITITNKLGSTLPETGGMGTTIFYVVGGILVLAAVALLATKKRSASK